MRTFRPIRLTAARLTVFPTTTKKLKKAEDKAPEVVVKADEKVKSSVIMTIMDAAQDAQYKKLIVAGEPLNKKDQKKLEEATKTETSNYTSNNFIEGATTPIPQENQYENWSQ